AKWNHGYASAAHTFDLPELNGTDMWPMPLGERKQGETGAPGLRDRLERVCSPYFGPPAISGLERKRLTTTTAGPCRALEFGRALAQPCEPAPSGRSRSPGLSSDRGWGMGERNVVGPRLHCRTVGRDDAASKPR